MRPAFIDARPDIFISRLWLLPYSYRCHLGIFLTFTRPYFMDEPQLMLLMPYGLADATFRCHIFAIYAFYWFSLHISTLIGASIAVRRESRIRRAFDNSQPRQSQLPPLIIFYLFLRHLISRCRHSITAISRLMIAIDSCFHCWRFHFLFSPFLR